MEVLEFKNFNKFFILSKPFFLKQVLKSSKVFKTLFVRNYKFYVKIQYFIFKFEPYFEEKYY